MARRDVLLATVAGLLVVLGTWRADVYQDAGRPLDAWGSSLAVGCAVALAWSRSAPLAALGATALFCAVYLLAGYAYGPVLACLVWAMFECARRHRPRTSALAGLAVAVATVAAAAPRLVDEFDLPALGLSLWAGCWLAVPWSLGTVMRTRAVAAGRERQELVVRAVLEERIRVAREVHDVAGHGFAVVAMQAGVALVVLDEQPEQARESLEAIRATSVAALDELRGVLAAVTPAPPDDLRALTERARAGGLPVTLRLDAVEDVRPELLHVAYHVVREALTNVLRHAAAAPTEVVVRRENGDLVVTVSDRGDAGLDPKPGRGLTGMRQRTETIGGTFTAGPGTDQGFVVTARLPLAAAR